MTTDPVRIKPGVGLGEINIGMPAASLAAQFPSYHETNEQGWDTDRNEPFELRVGWVNHDRYRNVWVFIETHDGLSVVTSVNSDDASLMLVTPTRTWQLMDVTENNVLEVFDALGVASNAVDVHHDEETQYSSIDAKTIGLCFVYNLNADPIVILATPAS